MKWFCAATIVFLAIIAIPIAYSCFQIASTEAIVGLMVLIGVEIVMLLLLASLYGTEYILTPQKTGHQSIRSDRRYQDDTSGENRIHGKNTYTVGIQIIRRQLLRRILLLASIGRAFMVMTNFKDGVLIKSKQGTYVITPGTRRFS